MTAYNVTSTPSSKTCATTGALNCTVSGLANHTAYTFKVTATNSVGTSLASAASGTVLPRPGASFMPLTPNRVLNNQLLANRAYVTFPVTNRFSGDATRNVPSAATAVTGVLTVSGSTALGYLALTPTPTNNPQTSTINFPLGDTRSTGFTVQLGTGSYAGTLSLTFVGGTGKTARAALDITGYFLPGSSGATYSALTPNRILESLKDIGMSSGLTAGTPKSFQVTGRVPGDTSRNVPSSAVAVTGTLTVTSQTKTGCISLGPDQIASPTTTSLCFPYVTGGDNRATGITVRLGSGGVLWAVYTAGAGGTTNILFDVTGFYIPGSAGAMYVPVTPSRILDTRYKIGLPGKLRAKIGVTFQVTGRSSDQTKNIPASAVAVTGILTVTNQTSLGYLALTKTKTNSPGTSTLNFPKGDNRATGVTVPLGPGGTLGITYVANLGNITDAIFDVSGYFIF
ncbi:MAG: hypothetical protein ABSA21_06760 [Candidatus Limnocylindrales bacterium]